MQLKLTPYSANNVEWLGRLKRGVVDASTLGLRPGHQFQPLYDDACDVGLALYNDKTQATVVWFWSEDVFVDGDLAFYRLKPTYESVRKYPGLEGYELHILND